MKQTTAPSRTYRWTRRLLILLAVYLLLAYIILPRLWLHHEHQPGLADLSAAVSYTHLGRRPTPFAPRQGLS